MKRLITLVFAFSILNSSFSIAATAPVSETGQTASYATGDDGNLKPGVSWPNPRFTDNSNGTVTDNLTGLIWLKNANCFSTQTWMYSLAYSNGLASGQCGLSDSSKVGDWRLPNMDELESLVDLSNYNPSLDSGHPFTSVQSKYYWSSSTFPEEWSTSFAGFVDMYSGTMNYLNDKTDKLYVWPVRSGQSGSFGNLTLSVAKSGVGTGSVTPNSGTITWTGSSGSTSYASGTSVALTAAADSGSSFTSWTGCDSSNGNSCTVTMSSAKTVTATFSDTTGPSISVFTLPGTATNLTVSITTFTVSDNSGSVSSYCLTETNSSVGCTWTTAKPTSYPFSTGGRKTLYAFAKDGTGNISNAAFSIITITLPDSIQPTVAITSPLNGTIANYLLSVKGSADDAGTGVSKVEVAITDGTAYFSTSNSLSETAVWNLASSSDGWKTWTLSTGSITYINTTNGTYTITARATDGSGNVSIPAVISFTRGTSSGGVGTTATLLLTKSEAAAGSITSNPTGLACDTLCVSNAFTYTVNSQVTLTATPAPGYYFLNWSNCDTPSGTTCTVTATSGHATITANFSRKSATKLTATTPQTQKLTRNASLTINGTLSTLPVGASPDLNGQDISVTVKPSTGTPVIRSTKTTNTSGAWQITLNDFTGVDNYQVEISYAGSDKLLDSAIAQPLSVLVDKSAGYAIVVQGKTTDNNLLNEHRYSAEDIIAKLKSRSLLDDDIKALYSDATTAITRQQIQDAITTWAKDKMNASPAPLYLIMVDHGDPEQFHIGTDVITPADLKIWLEALEANLTTQAKSEKRVFIIGACHSGSFIKELSAPGRIIIASAGPDEDSIGGDIRPWKNSSVNSGELFLESFFSSLATGENLKKSFEQARDNVEIMDPRRLLKDEFHYARRDKLMQHPLLDDNGDENGEYGLLKDGAVVASLSLGYDQFRTNGGDNPAYIATTSPTYYLSTTETSRLLWLTANDNSAVDYAFVSIRKLGSATTSIGSGQIILTFDKKELMPNNNQWEYTYTGFNALGTYEIFFYTRDKTTGFISPTVKGYVYKAKTGNSSPTQFKLISPNGSQESAYVAVQWEESSDGDGLTYTLQVSKDPTFAAIDYQKEGLTDNFAEIPNDILKDNPNGTTWYWQVIAIDQYGAKQLSDPNQKYSFTTSNTNGLPAIITGYLYNSTGVPLSGAITVGTKSFNTLPNGGFMFKTDPGTYDIIATATGYQTNRITGVTTSPGKSVNASMSLTEVTIPNQTWTIISVITSNGSVSCPSSAANGTPATCTVTPASGYQLETFTDNGSDMKSAVVGGSYSIQNVTANHTIVATFTLTPSTSTPPKAKIFLGADDNFTVSNSGTSFYGNTGNNEVTIAAGATGVILDQNIERINFSDPASNYTFKQNGNMINVYDQAGTTLIFKAPVQGDSDGTLLSFSNGAVSASAKLNGGVMTLGGATVNSTAGAVIPTSTLTIAPSTTNGKAKVFLNAEDNFTVSNSETTLYGNSGKGTVTIAAGTTGVTLDQNIGQINLSGAASSYTFKQTGNIINVYDGSSGNLIVKAPVQGDADGTVISFNDGTASVLLSGGVMRLGGAAVSSGTAGGLTPAFR